MTALPDGASILTWILALASNVFIIIFIVRVIGAFGKKEWGELVINVIAAVLVAGLIYSNDATLTFLKNLWNSFIGV
jgi:hypothetical protein